MVDGIYIHIPFCLNKCNYCDFLSFKSDKESRKKYVDYLLKEMELYPSYKYNTVYFGVVPLSFRFGRYRKNIGKTGYRRGSRGNS